MGAIRGTPCVTAGRDVRVGCVGGEMERVGIAVVATGTVKTWHISPINPFSRNTSSPYTLTTHPLHIP